MGTWGMMKEVRVAKSALVQAKGSLEAELLISSKLKDVPKGAFVERIDYYATNEIVFRWDQPGCECGPAA